jgi:hypothetical protein
MVSLDETRSRLASASRVAVLNEFEQLKILGAAFDWQRPSPAMLSFWSAFSDYFLSCFQT